MPRIKPFRGIRPHADYVQQVVVHMEGLSIDQARVLREKSPYSYVNMLVPKLENRFLRGSKKELVYKQINENFEEFLEKGIFTKDLHPALYIYRVAHSGIVQTGFWTTTSIDDYLNNTIKKHELTRAEREAGLIEYVQQTGIDANPVLITYPADRSLKAIITRITKSSPCLNFTKSAEEHWLWKIDAAEDIQQVVETFRNLPVSYIADGHHRAAAACSAGIERRKLNLKHKGDEEYNFFASIYMPDDELVILGFHRLVKGLDISVNEFLEKLQNDFDVTRSTDLKPSSLHEFGMYIKGESYKLQAKPNIYNHAPNPVDSLDVTILQNSILYPILNIADPRSDKRLSFAGGITPIHEIVKQIDEGIYDAAFILYPVSVNQLKAVADAGEVMPPKSTWFEPKFLTGLLIHQIT